MSKKIGFVILHYNAIKETRDCIASIDKYMDERDFHIIVVDNASPNATGSILSREYNESEYVTVICNDKNLGFAGGNNIGYRYAKEELGCEFVCVMNNDTLIIQDNFCSTIIEEYEQSKFGIMGPRIILKDGTDNQLYVKLPDMEFLRDELKLNERDVFLMRWHLDHFVTAYKMIKNYIYKMLNKKKKNRYAHIFKRTGTDVRQENLVLHGCAIIFSPEYAKHYNEAFNPNTFLYREEELLHLRCLKARLPMIYNPKLLIKHLEDASTDTIVKKNRAKSMFVQSNHVKSLKVLISEMEKM